MEALHVVDTASAAVAPLVGCVGPILGLDHMVAYAAVP